MPLLRWMLLLLAALLVAAPATAQTFPPLTGRVVDDAHLLDAAQIAQLTARSAEIEKASSRQFVVATLPDLQGFPIEEYGYKLGRAWKIGQAGANNGIILIVAPKERKVRIEVGRGLEPIMTDALSSVIINQTILPKFKAGDMAGGIVAGADAIAEQMKLPLEAAEQRSAKILATQQQQQARRQDANAGFAAVPVILIVLVVAFVGLSFFRRGAGGQRYTGGGGGVGGSGIGSTVANVALWSVLDGLSSRDRGGSWGGGSSGWGGGSSDGGGFSGGGGDFGGGGASGDW
ncbi:TPM domain-containing protein [Sphingomonas sp. GC_Shp_3]|uniref:TPM domain-containing protein n=1 Tax=Sphingomonas sp. GC_Shp_3 TaxID=2937383 RepID=UPI00226A0462|nr:TPM domain-containing protein [Sphingomonas sp. GC_Shp_3]